LSDLLVSIRVVIEAYQRPRQRKPLALAGALLLLAGCATKAEEAPNKPVAHTAPRQVSRPPIERPRRPAELITFINTDNASDVSNVAQTLSKLPEQLVLIDPSSRVGSETCRAIYSVHVETPTTLVIYPEIAGTQHDIEHFEDHPERTVHMDVDMGSVEGADNPVTSEISAHALDEAARAIVLLGKTGCDQYMRDIVQITG
jgi:hypothetical protein